MFEMEMLKTSDQPGIDILFQVYSDMVCFSFRRNFAHMGVLNGRIISACINCVKLMPFNYNSRR